MRDCNFQPGASPRAVGAIVALVIGLIVILPQELSAQEYFESDSRLGRGQSSDQQSATPSFESGSYFAAHQEGQATPAIGEPSPIQETQESPSDKKDETAPEEEATVMSDLQKRLEALEKDLKKAKDSEQKKKDDDASKPSVKLRGRLHADANWFGQDSANIATVGDIQDGTYFRRARLGVDGKAFEVTEFRIEMDFAASGRPTFVDVYGKVTDLPRLGSVQLGHFREPFSLEALSSSNFNPFMERAIFDEGRNWGIMAANYNEYRNTTWAAGLFRTGSDDFGNDIGDSGERSLTSRVTWLPYYDEPSNGRYFFELGTSYSYRNPDKRFIAGPGGPEESTTRFAFGPPSSLNETGVGSVPAFVSISVPDATDVQMYGIESTWNIGSLNFQGEFAGGYVDRFVTPSAFFTAAYIQASYFLTGESRQWDRKNGYWGRQQVFENFFRVRNKDCCICQGRGAWEVAARWNYVDLNDADAGLLGGYQDISTLGLNWYLTPYMRMMFDYSLTNLHDPVDGQSDCQLFATRLDISF